MVTLARSRIACRMLTWRGSNSGPVCCQNVEQGQCLSCLCLSDISNAFIQMVSSMLAAAKLTQASESRSTRVVVVESRWLKQNG